MHDLRAFTVTLCEAMGVTPPKDAVTTPYLSTRSSEPLTPLLGTTTTSGGAAMKSLGESVATKALIFCPDAFGTHALNHRPDLHKRLQAASTDEVELLSVFPPKTPVCFASLFTGLRPEQHGIRSYEKPVLKCETLFDALIAAGKSLAIVAVRNSSIDMIFRERALDYFAVDYDPLVTAKTLELLAADQHDVIVVYHQEYDDLLHETKPFSALAEKALEHHVESWELLVAEAKLAWKKNFFLAFTPDHGAHLDATGHGDHGDDRPEDMQLRHFFVR